MIGSTHTQPQRTHKPEQLDMVHGLSLNEFSLILKQLHCVRKLTTMCEKSGGNGQCNIFDDLGRSTAHNLFVDVDFAVGFP